MSGAFAGRTDRLWQRARTATPALLVVVLLVAAGLRFHLLGEQSLWHDEGNSYAQSLRTIGEIAEHAARDIHPPGYYWLLAGWRSLAGESEFALRTLSVFASLLSVAFTYALGTRLSGRMTGLAAAVLVALNTFSIFYAQEARMYALLAMWGAASMWAFVGLVRAVFRGHTESTRRWVLALALLNAGGLYTQYAFPFVLLAQVALVLLWLAADLLERRGGTAALRLPGYYAGAGLLTLLLYAPWLPTAWGQITTWPATGAPIPFSEAISTLLAYFAFGITVGGGTTTAAAFFLLFGLLVLPGAGRPRAWWYTLVPVAWVLVTVAAFLGLELFREANLKFTLPAQVAVALWIGRGVRVLWGLQPRRGNERLRMIPRLAALVGSLALLATLWGGLEALYHDPAYRRADYRALAAAIRADARPGDAVILNAPGQREVFSYYDHGPAPVYPLPPGLGGDDEQTRGETRAIIAEHDRIFLVLWGTGERDPNRVVEATLATEGFPIDSDWYGDVRLARYAGPVELEPSQASGARFGQTITLERYALSADEIAPGGTLRLALEWQTAVPVDRRYVVFAQLLDEDGRLVAQRDAEPGAGTAPTTSWLPGATVIDRHGLFVPNDLPPANYSLIIGLYNPDDPQERLPVWISDGDAAGDSLPLATIRVTEVTPQEAER
jgi:mannosyltransferase